MENMKEKYIKKLRTTKREGIENLIAWMENNGFFDAPCSGKHHLAQPGGLVEHSLNVMETAMIFLLTGFSYKKFSCTSDFVDSVSICTLLHDLGKTGQFGKANYVPDAESGKFTTNKELLYIPHEVRSIAIASKFIELTEEEQFAILYHNGLYGELQSIKGHETPLYMILHFADMWASRVIEK